jgi:hypothetical protein
MKFFQSFALVTLVITGFVLTASAQDATTTTTSGKKGGSTPAPQQEMQSSKKSAGRIKVAPLTRGSVVSLVTFKKVTAQEAGAMANKGALALMVGSRIYYVLKSDGTSAGDDLARLADGMVGVAGKTFYKGSARFIHADVIDVTTKR